LDIQFKNPRLGKICCIYEYAIGHSDLGENLARKLQKKIKELRAFETLEDIPPTPPFRRHKLKHNRKGQYTVDVDKKSGFRIIFEPNDNPLPRTERGEIDISRITSILVIEVENYHD